MNNDNHRPSGPKSGKTAYADCPRCGYKNALAITETKERTLYRCHAGCEQGDLLRTLKDIAPFVSVPANPRAYPQSSARNYIPVLWERGELPEGTVIETYLRNRCIPGPIPTTIRYLRNHLHKPTETYWPVMLAAVSDTSGRLRAVHRTYLAPDGSGKAPVQPPRMTLGPIGGLACHLSSAGRELTVAEGIETALSVQSVCRIPAWAALSTGGLERLILPPLPLASFVIVAADADPPGMKSAKAAAARWAAEGRRCEIIVPSRPGTDFNDMLREASL